MADQSVQLTVAEIRIPVTADLDKAKESLRELDAAIDELGKKLSGIMDAAISKAEKLAETMRTVTEARAEPAEGNEDPSEQRRRFGLPASVPDDMVRSIAEAIGGAERPDYLEVLGTIVRGVEDVRDLAQNMSDLYTAEHGS